MFRKFLTASLTGFAVMAAAAAQDVRMPQSDYWLKTEVTAGDNGMTVPMEMFHHDGNMRIETEVQGQKSAILMDYAGQKATVLVNAQGMRMAMDIPVQESGVEVPEAPQQLGEKISSDTIAGESCDVYRLPEAAGNDGGTMCMTSDNIVLRASDEQGGTVFEAQEFERGPQDASLFEVPDGYQRMQMPTGAGSMPMMGPQ